MMGCPDNSSDVSPEHGLDAEFASTMRRIEEALSGCARDVRVRGEQWALRLGMLSLVWQEDFQRDRNLHAELLLQCIEEGHWAEPFDRNPPDGPLPKLPPHVACALKRQKLERLELARGEGQMPAAQIAEDRSAK